ncbi:YkuS family protein [Oceanobacillus massiliensis]|uniref:YkuS family protein n=1 Tax=Oceanobacillus massiliensis TaxID=1465765 RepID=UPI0002883429|nr:YkuS family protein [Oceanobacillus massiliensis]
MARIGVEDTLTDVKTALMEMGHEIIDLRTEKDAGHCDCCVISGQDKDVMGMQSTSIGGPVINAQGQNAEDVCQMVNQKLS